MTKKRAFSDCAGSSSQPTRRKKGSVPVAAATDASTECIQCGEPASDKNSLNCVVCDLKHHGACCGWSTSLTQDELLFLKELGWVCPTCQVGAKEAFSKLQSQQAKLAEELLKLQHQLKDLQAVSVVTSSQPNQPTNDDSDGDDGTFEVVGRKGKHKAGTVGGQGKGASGSRSYATATAATAAARSTVPPLLAGHLAPLPPRGVVRRGISTTDVTCHHDRCGRAWGCRRLEAFFGKAVTLTQRV